MAGLKKFIGAAAILALALTAVVRAQSARADMELQRVLSKMRETYASLAAWHFEHKIVVEETVDGGKPVSLAEVTLTAANHAQAGQPVGVMPSSFCGSLCRAEAITARGKTVLVRDGKTTWLYSSARGEYMKGQTLRDVAMSVPGAMMLAVQIVPLTSFGEEQWTGVRLVGDETVEIGGERRNCYVLEADLRSEGLPLDRVQAGGRPDPPEASIGSSAATFLSLLMLQGLTTPPISAATLYFPAPAGVAPARVQLWIDKERSLVLKRSVVQDVQKITPTAKSALDAVRVQLRLTDTFVSVNVGNSVPDALFRFEPDAGTREVPNIRTAPAAQ